MSIVFVRVEGFEAVLSPRCRGLFCEKEILSLKGLQETWVRHLLYLGWFVEVKWPSSDDLVV